MHDGSDHGAAHGATQDGAARIVADPHVTETHFAPRQPGYLPPIEVADYLSLDKAKLHALSERIDLYFNTPLDMFPGSETNRKPHRFHVLFVDQIDARFPDDAPIRAQVAAYGRRVFSAMRLYMIGKRALQALALIGVAAFAWTGPALFSGMGVEPMLALGLTVAAMLLVVGVFAAASAIIFTQYRIGLENQSYELSREVVQRTRDLQNHFTNTKAMPDQAET
ncbi:MAG TPA: hypothetical protein VGB49_02335, partial [Caulobacteraceae bacterium]